MTDANGNSRRLENIAAYETAISELLSSEKYSVTVQAVNVYTQPFVYGAVSAPSNNAITGKS